MIISSSFLWLYINILCLCWSFIKTSELFSSTRIVSSPHFFPSHLGHFYKAWIYSFDDVSNIRLPRKFVNSPKQPEVFFVNALKFCWKSFSLTHWSFVYIKRKAPEDVVEFFWIYDCLVWAIRPDPCPIPREDSSSSVRVYRLWDWILFPFWRWAYGLCKRWEGGVFYSFGIRRISGSTIIIIIRFRQHSARKCNVTHWMFTLLLIESLGNLTLYVCNR